MARELDPKWALGAEVVETMTRSDLVREGKITKVTKTSVTVSFVNGGTARYIGSLGNNLKMVGQSSSYDRRFLRLASEAKEALLRSRALVLQQEAKVELAKFDGSVKAAIHLRKVLDDFISKKSAINEEARILKEAKS